MKTVFNQCTKLSVLKGWVTILPSFVMGFAMLLAVGFPAPTQARPEVEVVADLLETFGAARVKDALECVVHRPASAGGVKQNGFFEHPKTTEHPARVEYQLDLPQAGNHELLLLALEIALADRIKLGTVEDGVRFIVEADGKRIFVEETKEPPWQSQATAPLC